MNTKGYDDLFEAVNFLQDAKKFVGKVQVYSKGPSGECSLCCASYGGGKAKYEEKHLIK